MWKRYLSVLAAGSLALVGCDSKSPPGGPGAARTNDNSVRVSTPDNSFQLSVPMLETTVKQGEKKTVTISISRGTNFDQDVKMDFSEPPKGVKVTPADSTLKAGSKDMQVTIDAAPDAALGEHTITVTGTPAKEGAKTSATFKIQVKKP